MPIAHIPVFNQLQSIYSAAEYIFVRLGRVRCRDGVAGVCLRQLQGKLGSTCEGMACNLRLNNAMACYECTRTRSEDKTNFPQCSLTLARKVQPACCMPLAASL